MFFGDSLFKNIVEGGGCTRSGKLFNYVCGGWRGCARSGKHPKLKFLRYILNSMRNSIQKRGKGDVHMLGKRVLRFVREF